MTTTGYQLWLDQVREALELNNMHMDDWQRMWPFDFQAEYKAGSKAEHTAKTVNQFWWNEYNKSKVKCPDCKAKVRRNLLAKHLKKFHSKSLTQKCKSKRRTEIKEPRSSSVWTVGGGLPDSSRSKH